MYQDMMIKNSIFLKQWNLEQLDSFIMKSSYDAVMIIISLYRILKRTGSFYPFFIISVLFP